MKFAARVLDPTGHPGSISGPGMPNVLIGKKPAAIVGDSHTCAMPPTAGPHPTTTFLKGSMTVLIGNKPALRVGDLAGCGSPIIKGATNVVIGG